MTNAGSPQETRHLGEEIGKNLKPGDTVALFGELGAGKTTFVQGILNGLGIKDNATSPSFVLINEYNIPAASFNMNKIFLYHCDMYRLEAGREIEDLGMEDLFRDDSIVIIEWAEKVEEILPESCVKIYFKIVSDNSREITVKGGKK